MPAWHVAALTHRRRVCSANEDALAIDSYVLTGDMTEPQRCQPRRSPVDRARRHMPSAPLRHARPELQLKPI